MNKTVSIALTAGMLAVGAAQALAQETITNEVQVQSLNVALTGFAQDPASTEDNMRVRTVRITTRDLITASGQANARAARLIVVTPLEGENVTSSFFVRTGSGRNTTDTDVTGLFTGATSGVVERSTVNSRGVRRGTQYSIDQFQFGSAGTEEEPGTPVSFNVQGFTTTSLANQSMTSNVNGTGTVEGADAVLRGNVRISGARTETQIITLPPEG